MLGASSLQEKTLVAVVRSPDFGCCGAWIDHLRQSGFTVQETLSDDVDAFKDKHSFPEPLRSCHTALVEGYVIEGHVPAQAIRDLLDQRPDAVGLAVPGMPNGSPGVEMDSHAEPFAVIIWSGSDTDVFARY
nr:DUF411 domain-containing protein [Paracoccus saliphilus]